MMMRLRELQCLGRAQMHIGSVRILSLQVALGPKSGPRTFLYLRSSAMEHDTQRPKCGQCAYTSWSSTRTLQGEKCVATTGTVVGAMCSCVGDAQVFGGFPLNGSP